tara:strand:- start:90 stop:329 length:240 start_codon:yes stop_codon:yes gene_type:complete
VLFKKAATLLETSLVILFISILSVCLFKAGHGVYRIFVRMTTKEKSYYYYNTDQYRRKSDRVLWEREDLNLLDRKNFDR